jgi:hypothetical protein
MGVMMEMLGGFDRRTARPTRAEIVWGLLDTGLPSGAIGRPALALSPSTVTLSAG